jgi:hypothetical protein
MMTPAATQTSVATRVIKADPAVMLSTDRTRAAQASYLPSHNIGGNPAVFRNEPDVTTAQILKPATIPPPSRDTSESKGLVIKPLGGHNWADERGMAVSVGKCLLQVDMEAALTPPSASTGSSVDYEQDPGHACPDDHSQERSWKPLAPGDGKFRDQ